MGITLNERNKLILAIIAFVIILIFIFPYFVVTLYSLPRCDEYGHLVNIKMQGGISPISVWHNILYQYRTWQGSYFSAIFCYGLNPIAMFKTPDAISWFNTLYFVILFVAMVWLNSRLLLLVEVDSYINCFLSIVVSALMLNARYMQELIIWISGFAFYTSVFIIGLVSLYGILRIDRISNKPYRILALILAYFGVFCSAGGILQINVVLLFVFAVASVICFFDKKPYMCLVIGFVVELVGTIINVLSPGYYVRKGHFDSISFPTAGVYAVKCVFVELLRIIKNTYTVFGLAFVFIILLIVIKTGKRTIALNPFLITLASVICMLASTFPVVYGYAMPEMEDRGYGILDIMFVAWAIYFEMGICNWIKCRDISISSQCIRIGTGIVTLLFVITVAVRLIPVSNMGAVKCIKHLVSGEAQDYSHYWREKTHQFAEATGPDVVLEVQSEYMERYSIIYRPDVQMGSDDWVNGAIATWYGYDTLTIVKVD